jgi:hypothetical protein
MRACLLETDTHSSSALDSVMVVDGAQCAAVGEIESVDIL